MTNGIDVSQRWAAKVAAVAFLLSMVTVVGITYGVLLPLTGHVEPAQAAQNILAHQTQPFYEEKWGSKLKSWLGAGKA